VDPRGDFLPVQSIEANKVRLFRVPLHGGPEREIPLHGPVLLATIQISNSIAKDGRLLTSLGNEDSWLNPPGIVNLTTGLIERIQVDQLGRLFVAGLGSDWQRSSGCVRRFGSSRLKARR
jgi:hypothetical protein